MNTQAQQEPAVAVFLIKRYTDTFVIVIRNDKVFLLCSIGSQISNDFFAVFAEILFGNADTDLFCFNWLSEIFDQRIEGLAFHSELSRFDNDLCDQISAVIQEVVFFHCRMTGGFDRQRTANAVFILTDRLIDHILVAALKAQVLSA